MRVDIELEAIGARRADSEVGVENEAALVTAGIEEDRGGGAKLVKVMVISVRVSSGRSLGKGVGVWEMGSRTAQFKDAIVYRRDLSVVPV